MHPFQRKSKGTPSTGQQKTKCTPSGQHNADGIAADVEMALREGQEKHAYRRRGGGGVAAAGGSNKKKKKKESRRSPTHLLPGSP
jgi:hypothetical protein